MARNLLTYFIVRGIGILDSDGRGMPDCTGAGAGAATTDGLSMTTVALRSSVALVAVGGTIALTGRVLVARGATNWRGFNFDAAGLGRRLFRVCGIVVVVVDDFGNCKNFMLHFKIKAKRNKDPNGVNRSTCLNLNLSSCSHQLIGSDRISCCRWSTAVRTSRLKSLRWRLGYFKLRSD